MPKLLNPSRWRLLLQLIAIGFAQACALVAIAILVRSVVSLSGAMSAVPLPTPIAALLAANAVLGAVKWYEHVAAEKLGQSYIIDARLAAFRHLSAMSVHAQSQFRGGSLQLRFVNDLAALRQWVSLGLARMVVSGIVMLAATVALAVLNPMLGAVLCGVILVAVLGALLIGRSFDKRIREARKRRGYVAANIGEKIKNMAVVQAFANISQERRKVRRQANRLRDAMIERASVTGLFRGFMVFMVSIGLASIVAVGLANRSSESALADTLLALMLFSLISPSLFQLGRVFEYYKSATIAHEKLSALFERGPLIQPAPAPKSMPQKFARLKVERASIEGILKDVSLQIRAGERVIVRGANGAGKSTLLRLMLRLIEPDRGSIELNGKPITDLRTGQLRRCISIISPQLPLLKGTVRSNIAYGSVKADESQIAAAARLCAMNFGDRKSPFYANRQVSEDGANLSDGEKMRIIIARALVGAPQLLLLDEPDSHLDNESRVLVHRILRGFEGAWILATHTDFAADLADHHWQLKNQTLTRAKETLLS